MPFKAKAACRRHIPKPRHRVTNWAEYDADMRTRGSLTVWFSRDSIAVVLVADEDDDNPLALCTAVCSMCSTVHSTNRLLADWAERLAEHRRPSDTV